MPSLPNPHQIEDECILLGVFAEALETAGAAAIRAKGSTATKALAETRNIKKYGDKIGPSYDELIRRGKTLEEIIDAQQDAAIRGSKP